MRIVKPYGRSHVERDATAGTRRILRLRSNSDDARDIEDFARSHPELIIAQWISAIDKIATKPSGRNGATDEQRRFRQRLGDAAWKLLTEKGLVSATADDDRLAKIWQVKIAPYGSDRYQAKRDKQGRPMPPPPPKGRWYGRFAGDADPDSVDAAAVAAKIFEHLHEAEYRIDPGVSNRRQGRIAARAQSIAVNVLSPPKRQPNDPLAWSAEDEKTYAAAGDVAGKIHRLAEAREGAFAGRDRPAGPPRRSGFALRDAAPVLYEQYGQLFADNGKALSVAEARSKHPGLFALHAAIRDTYTRVLKDHKKSSVARVLPKDMPALFRLAKAKTDNRDLNALVRLGKIVHYESSGADDDSTADTATNWPADLTQSDFWTSDGQARIKRNEAFVRIWRHALALAGRTLTDWADPEGRESDILLGAPIGRATGERFDRNRYERKLDLLYGSRAEPFKGGGDDAFQKSVLMLALKGTAQLRHAAFHFKGLGGFARALAQCASIADARVLAATGDLWRTDLRDRAERLRKTMQGAHFDFFLNEAQNRALFAALARTDPGTIPLPRFNRVLHRAANAWTRGKDDLRLPAPANRQDLEHPARLCRYTALKLAYERPFRAWLTAQNASTINGFVRRATDRATAAARQLNARGDKDRGDMIVARAAALGGIADDETILNFFFDLSAETAGEMRVQRGYESDPDTAREQAAYIENLKCDVVALAFDAYLNESGFGFLRELAPDAPPLPDAPLCDLGRLEAPDVDTAAEDWQTALYFLVHLVPVDDIGRLLHQIRKWELLATDSGPARRDALDGARRIQSILELYLDMHDAKFEGGAAIIGVDPFKDLFQSERDFTRLFPAQAGATDDRRVPKRGLREIVRFGHLPALRPVFEKHRVATAEVEDFLRMERTSDDGRSEIARLQERREALHEAWTRMQDKKRFVGDDLRAYVEALSGVIRHRHMAAHATLTDHVRLHRLLMAVLGRLVDYAGLWERDLYFVALALIHQADLRPEDAFTKDGLEFLGQGQIVEALRKRRETPDARTVTDHLGRHFGPAWEKGNRIVRIRNDFAHFNMLKPAAPPVDLTACVNDARSLMAYDRKLKNAVSQSVKDILHREGLDLEWTMDADHHLGAATLATRQAQHLGKTRLVEAREPKPRKRPICENLHGHNYVAMVAALFGQATARKSPDATDLNLDTIDWNPARAPDWNRNNDGKNRAEIRRKGAPGRKNHRSRRP